MIKSKYLLGLLLLVLVSSENLVSKVLTNKEWFKVVFKTFKMGGIGLVERQF